MKAVILFMYFLLFLTKGFGQVNIVWQKSYGYIEDEEFRSIDTFHDTTFIITGYTEACNGFDVWLTSINYSGDSLYSVCFGGISVEEGYCVKRTYDHGLIIASEAYLNNGQVHGNHGDSDYWIIKLDSVYYPEWMTCYGGSAGEIPSSILQTSDSGYLVVGETRSNDFDVHGFHGYVDVWALKLKPDSSIQWSFTFGGSDADVISGNSACYQASDGFIYLAGSTTSNNGSVSGNHGSTDMWVIKLSANGQLIWQKCFGGSGADYGISIVPHNSNSFYIGGTTLSTDGDITLSFGNGDYWLLEVDTSGTIIWEKAYGGVYTEELKSICKSSDGGLIMAGYSMGNDGMVNGIHGLHDFWIVKVDSVGNVEWTKALGGSMRDEPTSVIELNDGSVLVAGFTESNDGDVTNNAGGKDAWVVKLSPAGVGIKDPNCTIMDLTILQNENNINLRFFSKHKQQSQVVFYNITGKKIFGATIEITEGINYYSLPQSFAKGIYCLQIKGKGFSETKKFIVQ